MWMSLNTPLCGIASLSNVDILTTDAFVNVVLYVYSSQKTGSSCKSPPYCARRQKPRVGIQLKNLLLLY